MTYEEILEEAREKAKPKPKKALAWAAVGPLVLLGLAFAVLPYLMFYLGIRYGTERPIEALLCGALGAVLLLRKS